MAETNDKTKGSEEKLSRSTILGLGAMAVGIFVVANDFTSLAVALPAMERDFGVDVTTIQWVINGYAMVFGVLIVTGGRLADMFGRRLAFFVGSAIFATFSVIGGLAPDVWVVLAARFLMGVGGALMWPATLGMTYDLLPKSKAGLAGGVVMSAAGLGNAVGPLIGGALTEFISWRWIFFLNLPVAVFGVLVTLAVIPKDKPTKGDHKVDYAGIAVLSAGLLALLLALDEGTDLGWLDVRIIGLFVVAAVALIGFALIERRIGARALVPRAVLANRQFMFACITVLLTSAVFFAALLYVPQYMMKQLGFTALQAGLGLLPVMGVFALTSFISGPAYNRFGAKITVGFGAAMLSGGMFLMSTIDPGAPYPVLIPGMVVMGIGVGFFYSSTTTAAMTSLDKSQGSLAGAIIYMCQIAGGSVGLGLNTAIVVSNPKLSDGISNAFIVDGLLAACGLVIVILFIGGRVDRTELASLIYRHKAHG
ncbi:MFS transporter [Bauldia sp.]|uniref:MFS transporter n=1 Tax=Bauldia sp. TaxID=2575872 RepID=UPI003BA98D61